MTYRPQLQALSAPLRKRLLLAQWLVQRDAWLLWARTKCAHRCRSCPFRADLLHRASQGFGGLLQVRLLVGAGHHDLQAGRLLHLVQWAGSVHGEQNAVPGQALVHHLQRTDTGRCPGMSHSQHCLFSGSGVSTRGCDWTF